MPIKAHFSSDALGKCSSRELQITSACLPPRASPRQTRCRRQPGTCETRPSPVPCAPPPLCVVRAIHAKGVECSHNATSQVHKEATRPHVSSLPSNRATRQPRQLQVLCEVVLCDVALQVRYLHTCELFPSQGLLHSCWDIPVNGNAQRDHRGSVHGGYRVARGQLRAGALRQLR